MTGQSPKRRESDEQAEKRAAKYDKQEIRKPIPYEERKNRDLTRGEHGTE